MSTKDLRRGKTTSSTWKSKADKIVKTRSPYRRFVIEKERFYTDGKLWATDITVWHNHQLVARFPKDRGKLSDAKRWVDKQIVNTELRHKGFKVRSKELKRTVRYPKG